MYFSIKAIRDILSRISEKVTSQSRKDGGQRPSYPCGSAHLKNISNTKIVKNSVGEKNIRLFEAVENSIYSDSL